MYVSSKRDITLEKQLGFGSPGNQVVYFSRPRLIKKCRKLTFHVFLPFYVKKHMTSSLYLKWTKLRKNFIPIVGPQGSELNWNKFTISCAFGPLQVKWWYYMFCSIKMEEYMGPKPSGIFCNYPNTSNLKTLLKNSIRDGVNG